MRVLVACEFSGVVREAFRKRGHDAWSCDLLPASSDPLYHLKGDVITFLEEGCDGVPKEWDLIIAHPPCTYLFVSGIHWNNRGRGWEKTERALEFVKMLMDAPAEKICIENPVSIISSRIRKPDQIIQPYEFGDDASKKTCLWLKNLPSLVKDPSKRVPGRIVNGKERWSNQTNSGQNKLGPSETRGYDRSITYQGVAEAMAEQWG
jgi:site-specific DNA-cytosine methylase